MTLRIVVKYLVVQMKRYLTVTIIVINTHVNLHMLQIIIVALAADVPVKKLVIDIVKIVNALVVHKKQCLEDLIVMTTNAIITNVKMKVRVMVMVRADVTVVNMLTTGGDELLLLL